MTDQFSLAQKLGRLIVIAGIISAFLLLRVIDPAALGAWLPFHTSCGAITGLPCIFCGLTRATHYLLNGDVNRALYFNWLVFPVALIAIALVALFTIEFSLGRKLIRQSFTFHLTGRRLTTIMTTLLALWAFQAYLAVSQHKTELLNPRGPLYVLFVR